MLGFFRHGGVSGTELALSLYYGALAYTENIQKLWELTPYEISESVRVKKEAERKRLEDSYRRNELLAFNIGALCRTAVNAPLQFPKTPSEAFGYSEKRGNK